MDEQIIQIKAGDLCFRVDLAAKDVVDDNGKPLGLSDLYWRLLNFFVEKGSCALLSYNDLVVNIWTDKPNTSNEAVAQAVRSLRAVLGEQFIETVYGRGFKFTGSVERLNRDDRPSALPRNRKRFDELEQATEDNSASGWSRPDAIGTDGLADLRLYEPRPGNQAGTFYLDATLRVDVAEHEQDDRIVAIGLRNAFLSIESVGCQPSKGTMIGERIACETVHAKPRGVEFTAAIDHLTGELLGEEYIAAMESTVQGEQSVTLELRAGRRSFNVTVKGADDCKGQDTTTEKTAILNTFIYQSRSRDGQGRVVLARAKMWKRPRT